MKNKEADQIIKNYKSYKGFYDLSKRPKSLTKIEYAKVLEIQNFLIEQSRKKEYLKEFESVQYEEIKELSARYQIILGQYWPEFSIIREEEREVYYE